MQASELRIGNLVMDAFSNEVITIKAADIVYCEKQPDMTLPIPLTDEWLLKCGFHLDRTMNPELGLQESWSLCSIRGSGKVYMDQPYSDNDTFPKFEYDLEHIQYLHQLQNLYHAIAGEELVVKI